MAPVAEWWKNETFIPLDWSPPEPPAPPARRRWRRLPMVAIVVLVAVAAGLGGVAWREHTVAARDQALVRVQAHQLQVLQSQVATNRALATSTSRVTGELQQCIDARAQASASVFAFFTGVDKKAEATCRTAEADYQQLLSNSGSAP